MSAPKEILYPISTAPWHTTIAKTYKQGVIWIDHNCVTHSDTIYAQCNGAEYKCYSLHSAKCWISAQMRRNS